MGPSPTMSPVNQLRMGIERSTRSVIVGCGGKASVRGRSFVRRTVGMCVMKSDSGLGSADPVVTVTGRWVRVGEAPKLVEAPVAVAVAVVVTVAVAVPEVAVVVDSLRDNSSSSRPSLAVPARLFMAKDRGRVEGPRPISLLLRNAVECAVVRVRGPRFRSWLELDVSIESLGTGISSAGPWPWYSSQKTRWPSISCGE